MGEDQLQHLELARDIVTAFHARFLPPEQGQLRKPVFQVPVALSLSSPVARVMSLTDGTRKVRLGRELRSAIL